MTERFWYTSVSRDATMNITTSVTDGLVKVKVYNNMIRVCLSFCLSSRYLRTDSRTAVTVTGFIAHFTHLGVR